MYCCDTFAAMIDQAGERGAAIVLSDVAGTLVFKMQYRAVRFDDSLPVRQSGSPLIVNLCHTLGILFCPFCGCDLFRWIEDHKASLATLANRHRSFVHTVTDAGDAGRP